MAPDKLDCKELFQSKCMEYFRRLEERLSDVQAGIAEIRTIYESQQHRVDRVERTLYGDGNTGLCTKVSAILWLSSAIAGFVALLLGQAVAAWVK